MEKIPQIYDVAKNLYDRLDSFCLKMYKELEKEESFEMDLDAMEKSLDNFVQAVLFKVALADDRLEEIELDFVKSIVNYDDLFKNFTKEDFTNDECIKECAELADATLDEVPLFVKLAVMSDKYYDSKLMVLSPTNCQVVYDNLRRIANYLKFIDGLVCEEEDKVGKDSLQSVIEYFKKKYVRYAPSRKEN